MFPRIAKKIHIVLLSKIGGKDVKDTTNKLLDKYGHFTIRLLTNKMMTKFNRKGSSPKRQVRLQGHKGL
ncbi:hypothetical protein SKAU_G00421860 [Synaphobranchus kaupii]|uniref:Uncharacterized protein n=1 Tax=Synaphobranchus kaupii TaxID=118154 RepID=A0A9Q1E6U3_SYNKA|nr:hypothetical protein SKAU_G00421860 [Synaphobranchus kaupii]